MYLQAIIDRRRASVPMAFYLSADDFDMKHQEVKASHPNAKNFNIECLLAKKKAHDIASKFRIAGKPLTPTEFRNEFKDPSDNLEFIKFIKKELALRRPQLAPNTYKQHNTVVNKLTEFRKCIYFSEISIELMQKFHNFLMKKDKDGNGLKLSTVNKVLKIVKHYLSDARQKGIACSDPFKVIKIKTFKSNRMSLLQEEVDKMDEYFRSADCPKNHRKVLQYFLFSCYSGLRISDVKLVTWDHIHGDLLQFEPVKTRSKQKTNTIPLRPVDLKYLPERREKGPIFDTYSDQVTNRLLKDIASHLGIKKNVTYHTSRHTMGTLFAEGGNIVALKDIMGHEDIKTTIGYVHTSTKNLVDAKKERFG